MTGRHPLGNAFGGVFIFGAATHNGVGGPHRSDRNVISANGDGVRMSNEGTRFNWVQGNLIGTVVRGKTTLGNVVGVSIVGEASQNAVGGRRAGAGNVIANNDQFGVEVSGGRTAGDAVLGNSLFANRRRGISLRDGANNHAWPPVVNIVTLSGGSIIISGSAGPPPDHRIQIFANPSCLDPEGRRFLGSVVTSHANWSLTLPKPAHGAGVTATSTDLHGNTSEFSNCAPT